MKSGKDRAESIGATIQRVVINNLLMALLILENKYIFSLLRKIGGFFFFLAFCLSNFQEKVCFSISVLRLGGMARFWPLILGLPCACTVQSIL